MAKRFRKHGDAYFTFVTTPGVEPTNNLAEQAIRFVVIDRHITQGTRSEQGRQWSERIWTVIASCAQQGKSVYGFLREVVESSFAGTEAPVAAGPDGMRTRRHPGQRRQVEEADGAKANVSGTTESIGCKAVTSWEVSEANLPRTKDEGR